MQAVAFASLTRDDDAQEMCLWQIKWQASVTQRGGLQPTKDAVMLLPSNLLVAIDFNPQTDRVLDTAFAFAERFDAKVHLVHAFTLSELSESELRSADGLAQAERSLENKLQQLAGLRRAGGRLGEVIIREGDPLMTVSKLVAQLNADLLIVDTYHRGFARLAHGSFAEALVRTPPCALLILRHDAAASG